MSVDIAALKLPAVSSECSNVLELIEQEDISVSKLSDVISLDPVLSSTLLKYANSPLYRRSNEVTSVNTAINLLGTKNVSAAVMMATMRAFSSADNEINLKIWEHSVAISTINRLICKSSFRALGEQAELIGILHDMPALVISTNFPDEYLKLLESARDNSTPHEILWLEMFGISQDDVMARVANDFRLPEGISSVLCAYHSHQPITGDIESEQDRLIAIMALAHHLEKKSLLEDVLAESLVDEQDALLEQLDLTEDDFANLIEDSEWALAERMQV